MHARRTPLGPLRLDDTVVEYEYSKERHANDDDDDVVGEKLTNWP